MDRASVHTGNALEQFLQHNRTLIPECLYLFNQHNRLLKEVKRGRLHLYSGQFSPDLSLCSFTIAWR